MLWEKTYVCFRLVPGDNDLESPQSNFRNWDNLELRTVLRGSTGVHVTLPSRVPPSGSQSKVRQVHQGNSPIIASPESPPLASDMKRPSKMPLSPSGNEISAPDRGSLCLLSSLGLSLLQDPAPVILHYLVNFLMPSSMYVLFLI